MTKAWMIVKLLPRVHQRQGGEEKLSKKGFSFFNITDAQFGVNNFNAFLHYQLWLRASFSPFVSHSSTFPWHLDVAWTQFHWETLPEKKSLVNGVVTCVRVVIKIDASLLNSKDPKSIVYRDTCVETGKKKYSLESKRRKDEMKFILMKILRFRSRRMIK